MGPLRTGSTTLQRFNGFRQLSELTVYPLDSGRRLGPVGSGLSGLWRRVRHKLGWPADIYDERRRLLETVKVLKSEVVLIDGSKVLTRGLLRRVRAVCDPILAYYIPDDVIARHNRSQQLIGTFPEWDIFFTTKSFNVLELSDRGVKLPVLVGNAFDPWLHRPMTKEEVGTEYELFDLVFIGTCEKERLGSINRLAEAGFSLAVYGNGWRAGTLHPAVSLRPAVYAEEYTRAQHVGKVSLCFLRKINRDQITTRSIEIPAMARPMLAERTEEHDAHLVEGAEYLGFSDDHHLVGQAHRLIADETLRRRVAERGRQRCLESGYSTVERAYEMAKVIFEILEQRNGRAL
jgi:spore maturation protein CgeB